MSKAAMATASVLVLTLWAPAAWANGGQPSSSPRMDVPAAQKTPKQLAVEHYNRGLKYRDQAWKAEEKARQASDEKKLQKQLDKAQKQFQKAIKEFGQATELVDGFYQAYSSLGYALRRTGNYQDSLAAYDQALEINPGYVEAIEYRAEAYLGLTRLEDAKSSYLLLLRQDREQADKLLQAMKEWVGKQRQESSVDAATLEAFAQWVAERDSIARTIIRTGMSRASW